MPGPDSVAQFKFKRTLEQLSKKEGRGTELISLYVPPDRKIHEVLGQLREELGTAVNIKSRTTRNNVQDGIERTMQRLKLFKEPPPTGLVIFAGAIPQNGAGSEKMETFTLIPPEPIVVWFYRCDARFHVEPLLALVADKDTYGILVIDGTEAVVASLKGRRVEILKTFTSGTRQEQGRWTVCPKIRADQRTSHQRLLQTRRSALQRDDAGNPRPERNHHRRPGTHEVRL